MKKSLPVLNISDFSRNHDFYAETFLPHIQQHDITHKPHKHDFFLVALFTKGSGTHEIDFTTYKITPGTVFFLSPGQTHQWQLSADIDGFIFFHTRAFFEKSIGRLRDFTFFSSVCKPPLLKISKTKRPAITALFAGILSEYRLNERMKELKLASLVTVLYVEMQRISTPQLLVKSESYLDKFYTLDALVEKHFRAHKYPSDYARMMSISERHLNRICKECVNKTSSQVITDRVLLEAKNLLMRADMPVSLIAEELGYYDPSYFSRMFKKATGLTPKNFAADYRQQNLK